jgi:23S rRNA (uracil1939-C5)-methyltransferase
MTAPVPDLPTEAVAITHLDGRGHGRARGVPGAIPGALPGERVDIEWSEDARGRRFGRVRRTLDTAPDRRDPQCPQYDRCPGCTLRHIDPAAAATWKRSRSIRAVPDDQQPASSPLEPVEAEGYRARAVAHALRDEGGQLVLGMRPLFPGQPPIGLDRCPAQDEASRALLATLTTDLRRLKPPGLRHVVVHADRVVLGFFDEPARAPLVDGVLPHRPDVALLYEVVPEGAFGVLVDPRPLRGPTTSLLVTDQGDRLRATLPAWTPQTPGSLPRLRDAVLGALEADGRHRVLEVGCGVGTLSLPIARRVEALVGVDIVRAAVDDARHNAEAHGVRNATFRLGRADHAVRRLIARGARFDRAVLHAMRRPFGDGVLRRLAAAGVQQVAYVAPVLRSLVQDVRDAPGWRIEALEPVDQLPGTVHLTWVARITRG